MQKPNLLTVTIVAVTAPVPACPIGNPTLPSGQEEKSGLIQSLAVLPSPMCYFNRCMQTSPKYIP
ncbi:hypothetical protein L873DRAFT_79074 [Choiromyces venosus 120613-1]|uniref:Uncharacterized protein n=1 Tax=Choiromyces venosus 120613-1 TaxID=1336337 RepID=A0A3N4J877_9PEZI|nr:hypothetical protein L873DRAFT_79074 [Choiromyces venosus 120613-1]